jgi:muconolactone delta-isomerase
MGVKILRGAAAARSAGATGQRNTLDPSFVERVRAKAAASSRTLTAKA